MVKWKVMVVVVFLIIDGGSGSGWSAVTGGADSETIDFKLAIHVSVTLK